MAKQSLIERWIEGEQLGKGGQGATYRVEAADGCGHVAVLKKLLNNKSEQARRRIFKEVASLEVVHQAGGKVPKVIEHNTDQFKDPSIPLYIVMERIEGQTLAEYIASQGTLTLDQAVGVVSDLSKTIGIGHREDVLHRDLKPENIIIRSIEPPDVVIVDYGLSFNLSPETVTETGDTIRNKFLDLPETNTPSGDLRDPRSDIAALCAMLYYCLTGHRPGQLQDGNGRLPHRRPSFSVKEKLAPDPRVNAVEAFFDRGLAYELVNRFQGISEFQESLERVAVSAIPGAVEDPILLASRLSEKVRRSDRKTIEVATNHACTPLCNMLHTELEKLSSKLGVFGLALSNDPPARPKHPVGPTYIRNIVSFHLNISHHNDLRGATYALFLQQNACRVMRIRFSRIGDTPVQFGEWEELLTYIGSPMERSDELKKSCIADVNEAMQQLETELSKDG